MVRDTLSDYKEEADFTIGIMTVCRICIPEIGTQLEDYIRGSCRRRERATFAKVQPPRAVCVLIAESRVVCERYSVSPLF